MNASRPEPGTAAGELSATDEPRRPKRGAFPTPRSETDRASPYRPDQCGVPEQGSGESDGPRDEDVAIDGGSSAE
jgi:hypothetical protein